MKVTCFFGSLMKGVLSMCYFACGMCLGIMVVLGIYRHIDEVVEINKYSYL